MKSILKNTMIFYISIIVLIIFSGEKIFASHAQGTDITYRCLGGNQYQINLSFYRDCAGVAAPNTASVNVSSISCGQNFNITLNRLPGTGIDVTPICPSLTTQCSGGNYPGVQEYLYTGVVTLPAQCADWVFGFTLCCRNAAITTIVNPANENIYVESTLNNLDFSCNNSPSFLNRPIPFVCVGQSYCYNNGASEREGDSIYYRLITPKTSANTTVTYNAPYSASQPLSSTPAVSFNNIQGSICMSPNFLEITVFAIIVEEWRNQKMVGSVMRDIQLKTITCTNINPYVNGINNTGNYSLTACAGQPISFTIPTFDPDANQNVGITWDNGISAGTFISSAGSRPIGTFTWTPTTADISSNPYCFTVTVFDDNCVYYGSQVFSFCITVIGYTTTTSSTNASCGNANGTASVQVSAGGIGPYTYSWSPSGGNSSTATGLAAGTYSVLVTPTQGCPTIDSVVVGGNGGPLNVNLTSTNVLCFGATTGSVTANATGAQQPYSYSWSNGPTTPTNNGLGAGVYTVVVTSNNGCSATVAAVISQPTAALSYTMTQSNVTCSGLTNGTATVTASGGTAPYTYLWPSCACTTSTATGLASGNYSVIITDANGCSTTGNVTITQPNQLIASNASSTNVTCFGAANGTASTNVSGGTTPYTYSWNTNPAQTSPTASGLAPGNYTVIITDANNCSASSSITITEPAALTLNTSGININCFGAANGQATVNANGGTPNYTYQWTPAGGNGTNATGLNAGTYTVSVSDNNGCTNSGTVTITEPSALAYTITQSNITCYGAANGSANINVTGGITPYSYYWNTTPAQTTANPTITVGGNYSVIVTDGNGCTISTSITINEPTLLTANAISVSNVKCNGLANGSATVSATGGTTPYTYQWNTIPAQNTQTVSGLAAGTYMVTVTDANNCTAISTVTITQPTLLTLNTTSTNVTCNGAANGQGVAMPNGGVVPYTYQWSPTGGTNANTNGLNPGTYTVLVTDNNGCTKTASISITEPTPLVVTATGNTTICSGQNAVISASATGGNGTYTFTWTGNGSLSGPTHSVSPTATTTYVVNVTDASGCPGNPVAITINVTSLTAANLTVSPGVRICEGNGATIFSSVTGNTGPVTVTWNNGLGNGNGPFNVSPKVTTTYIVTVTDACNKTVTGSVTVIVSPLPIVNIFPLSGVACEQVPLTFVDNNPANNNAHYLWSFGDGNYSTQQKPTYSYVNSGVYNISVVVTSVDGCVDSAGTTATITVYPASRAKFESEGLDGTTISPIYRFINTSSNSISYMWNFGDGTTASSVNNNSPIHEYKQAGEYLVSLTTVSKDGCPGYYEMKVAITPEFVIYIPNAFTPDGDGTNDVFIPKGIEIAEFNMEIYSRWGEMIYRTNDLTKGWDGRANFGSDIAQQDVYVYKINVKDVNKKSHTFTGHVTLLKNDGEAY